MTSTTTNSTVSADQASEALAFFAPEGVIYTAARAGLVGAHRTTLERFIAQHSDVEAPSAEPVAAGWRLLEVGDEMRPTDEWFDRNRGVWFTVKHSGLTISPSTTAPIRRRIQSSAPLDSPQGEAGVACYGLRRKGTSAIIGLIPTKVHANPPSEPEFLERYDEVPLYLHPATPAASTERNDWREAVLDALALYGVDRPSTDTPAQVVQHVLACYAQMVNDPQISANAEIEESVIKEIRARRDRGRAKYGTTMERADLSTADWLQHLLEELLDAAIYAKRAQRDLRSATQGPIATVRPSDAIEGVGFSKADWARLDALPHGTKLYLHPAPEGGNG